MTVVASAASIFSHSRTVPRSSKAGTGRRTYRLFRCATRRRGLLREHRLLAGVAVDVGVRLVEVGAFLS
jgi:hypothetical protein